ncbi:MAG: NAD-dependent epimerase/dehydratase family protein [PVC group bacterium]
MKILLTGGAGCIGSHLADALLAEGHRVVIVDDFNDYYDPRLKAANLAAVRDNPRLTVEEADIRDRERMEELFARHRFPAVIHLAARAGVRPSLARPLIYQDVNVGGTLVLLEAARRSGTEKFLFASSSSVYGDCPRLPLCESEPALQPVSPYGLTKLIGEHCCRVFHRQYGLRIAALRFFTVYGPRQRPDMAIHFFSRCIRRKREIPVYGDGTSRRDYTFIGDIVAGILSALRADCGFEVFNLGGGHAVTLAELIGLLGEKFGAVPVVKRLSFQPGDVVATLADVGKARQLLGYRPSTALPEGLQSFVSWFRTQPEGAT